MTSFAANPLLPVFGEPQRIAALTATEWDRLLRLAQPCGLGARLAALVTQAGVEDRLPPRALLRLDLALTQAEAQAAALPYDLAALDAALIGLRGPIVWLNAVEDDDAPSVADGPALRLELLTPPEHYPLVLERLALAGWHAWPAADGETALRRRTGEAPPLVHPHRETVIDLRHAVLPARRRRGAGATKTASLFAAAAPIPGTRLLALSPHDRLLVASTKLFAGGASLAVLLELADLIDRHRDGPGFWEGLVPRAQALGLTGPLFHALRYLRSLLRVPIPAHVLADGARVAELTWLCGFIDWAAPRAALSAADRPADWQAKAARLVLDLRVAWLRLDRRAFTAHAMERAAAAIRSARLRRTSRAARVDV
jgi:hypothetical protein